PSQNDFVAFQRVARQTGGKPLLSQFDPAEPAAPAAPYLQGSRTSSQALLSWTPPDDGGEAISSYRILRGISPGMETNYAKVAGTKTLFIDQKPKASVTQYYYKVIAVNAKGVGVASNEVVLAVTQTASVQKKTPGRMAVKAIAAKRVIRDRDDEDRH